MSGSGGCTTPRDDLEDMGLSSDQRERSAAIDKEWNLPKGGNKYVTCILIEISIPLLVFMFT